MKTRINYLVKVISIALILILAYVVIYQAIFKGFDANVFNVLSLIAIPLLLGVGVFYTIKDDFVGGIIIIIAVILYNIFYSIYVKEISFEFIFMIFVGGYFIFYDLSEKKTVQK